MKRRERILHPDKIPLAPGTRVVLQQRYDDANGFLKLGTMGQVKRLDDQGLVEVETPAGRLFKVPRAHLIVQKQRVLARAAARQLGWEEFKGRIILGTVVGSHAWGLAGPGSDQDIKGVFVWPFEAQSGFYTVSNEIQDPRGDGQYWEIGKLVHQALNADPNTLEALWSPLIVAITPLGKTLLERRRIFVSSSIVGSFGRYALSQFKKIEKRLEKGDPGTIARPKNAYNLIRLLHSALRWIREGEPLMTVEGAIRDELMAIKRSERPIEDVLKQGFDLAAEVEQAHSENSVLPEQPDFEAAHELLIEFRRAAARNQARMFTSRPSIPAPILSFPDLQEWSCKAEIKPDPGKIKGVIFDLDDTLFDCFNQCVLAAHKEAAQAMIDAGLKANVEDVYDCRLQFRSNFPGCLLEEMVAAALGVACHEGIAKAGQDAFFSRDPGPLVPFPQSLELLQTMRKRGFRLGLVTRGNDQTQQTKIDALGLRECFDEIHVVGAQESKGIALKAFGAAQGAGNCTHEEILVVGDNIRDEITQARDLGMWPCHFARGEFPKEALFRCWTIRSLDELGDWL
jgi:uncharacterized protein